MSLKVRFGGGDNSNSDTDFSHLENNPNYKPEETQEQTEIVEPTGEEQTITEPESQEDINTADTPTTVEGKAESSLNDESAQPDVPIEQPEIQPNEPSELSDDVLFKHLSEKLGREVSSLDDLKQKEEIEIDSQIKALNEWKQKTGRPIEDFFKFQKDFSEVSDLDIAREFLQIEYPTLTKEEVNLELELKFKEGEDDLDTDIARKKLELKKYASKGRNVLNELKGDLGEPSSFSLTPEIQEQVNFAKEVQQQIEANKGLQEAYYQGISEAAIKAETLPLKLSDDFSIDFKINEEDRKTIPSFINEMPHWRKEDGSWNHEAVVQDSIKIKHFDKMVQLAYEQGLNAGKDELIKETKNTTFGNSNSQSSQQGQGKKKPVYENFKLSGQLPSLKF